MVFFIESTINKEFVVRTLADKYNELLTIIEDEHISFSGKRDLEAMGDLIETIAYDLKVGKEFDKEIHGTISWKK